MNIKSFSEKGRGRFESLNFLTLCLYLVYCWVLLLPVEYGIGREADREKEKADFSISFEYARSDTGGRN